MPRMGKTEEDWNGLKQGFWKLFSLTVFQSWSLLLATSNIMLRRHICLGSLILSFTCDFFAYFKFHSHSGRVIRKIKQNELDCSDTVPLIVLKICTVLSSTDELTSSKCVENIPFVLYWLDSTAKKIFRLRQVIFGLVQSGPQSSFW